MPGPVRRAVPALLFIGLLVITAMAVLQLAERSVSELPVLGELPAFSLTTHAGESFGRADLAGKITILELMFTSCPDACPIMDRQLVEIYRATEGSERIQLVSVTVDPERDTREVLAAYARELGVVDDRWVFLRGELDEVRRLSVEGLKLGMGELPAAHPTRFVLADGEGRIRGYYDALDPASVKTLKTHLRRLALARPSSRETGR
jgi:protein SCO1/2